MKPFTPKAASDAATRITEAFRVAGLSGAAEMVRDLTVSRDGGPVAVATRYIVETRGAGMNSDTRTVSECRDDSDARSLAATLRGAKLFYETVFSDGSRHAALVE